LNNNKETGHITNNGFPKSGILNGSY